MASLAAVTDRQITGGHAEEELCRRVEERLQSLPQVAAISIL